MVADSTGRSAILEWVGADADHDADGAQRQLNVLWNDTDALSDSSDWQVVTNFIKAPATTTALTVRDEGLDRYEHLAAALRADRRHRGGQGRCNGPAGLGGTPHLEQRRLQQQHRSAAWSTVWPVRKVEHSLNWEMRNNISVSYQVPELSP